MKLKTVKKLLKIVVATAVVLFLFALVGNRGDVTTSGLFVLQFALVAMIAVGFLGSITLITLWLGIVFADSQPTRTGRALRATGQAIQRFFQ